MSTALEKIEKSGYRVVALKSAEDVKAAKLHAKVDDLCSGEVSGAFAAGLFNGEDANILQAFKVVKKGDAKATAGIIMFVSPMRVYEKSDEVGKFLNENAKALDFDQLKQSKDAMELLVFCVEKSARGKNLGTQMLLHAVELSKKRYVVVGQDLGPASEPASIFYGKLFSHSAEGVKDGKKFRFYAGLASEVAKALGGSVVEEPKPATKPAAATKTTKTTKKPASAKKPAAAAAASASGKRRRTGKVCGKVVKRSDSFLNAVGKLFKQSRDASKVDSTLSMNAACAVDAILRDSLEKIGANINSLLASKHSKTVDARTVSMAIQLTFGAIKQSQLSDFMLKHSLNAALKYQGNTKLGKKMSVAARSGLTIAPARVVRLLRASRVAQRFGKAAGIHLAAALEYLTTEIFSGSLDLIKQSKLGKGRVTPRVVMLCVQGDEELRKVIRGTFGRAGVVPMAEFAKKAKN